MKKLMAMLLSVTLISTSVAKVQASWFSDLCGGIFTILSAPIWIFCQDNEFFRKQNPFRKKAWQELEEKENQILETDRRIESAISRIATRTVVEPSREPIVVAADIDYDKIIRLVLKAMPKPERPEEIDYDKLAKALPCPEFDYNRIETKIERWVSAAVEEKVKQIEKAQQQEPICSNIDLLAYRFCAAVVGAHVSSICSVIIPFPSFAFFVATLFNVAGVIYADSLANVISAKKLIVIVVIFDSATRLL
jgi:hypothetical protein